MGSPAMCLSCAEKPVYCRGVCKSCRRAIRFGWREDVMLPPAVSDIPRVSVRSPEAVAARMAFTLSRHPHLRRS